MYYELSDGARMGYDVIGEGEPLVFLPGVLGSCKTYENILPAFQNRFRCILIEFVGQASTHLGPRSKPSQFTVERHADDVTALLNYLQVDCCHLVGLSFGSLVSIELARRMKGCVGSLTLLASLLSNQALHYRNWSFLWDKCSYDLDQFTRINLGLLFSESYLHNLGDAFAVTKDLYAQLSADNMTAFRLNLGSARDYDVHSAYLSLECPVRFIHGQEDLVHPIGELAERLAQIGHSDRLRVLPGTGHGLHVEAADYVVTEIECFYDELCLTRELV